MWLPLDKETPNLRLTVTEIAHTITGCIAIEYDTPRNVRTSFHVFERTV